jgi:UDP-N-acetylmuramate dehydrogenase
MMPASQMPGWIESLPKLRGRIQTDAPLAPFTWFRAGGAAEVLIRPSDANDLADLLRNLPHEVPVHVIGACSNLIVRDGGLPGVTIRLARGFSTITPEADGIVAGAAALDVTVAEHAAAAGLAGLEFLSGIPGSIGGAVAMNAGAYGGDMATVLDWAEIVTRTGEQRRLTAQQLAFAYRHAALPAGAVVTRVHLRATTGASALIATRMAEIKASREASQPVRARTGGSTFRNLTE